MRKHIRSVASQRVARSLAAAIAVVAAALPLGRAGAEPGFFNLTTPGNGTVMQWTQQLQWAAAPNATDYTVEMIVVGDAQWGNWNAPIQFPVANRTNWGHNPDTLDVMQGKQIQWRVRACDANEQNPQTRCRLNNGNPWSAYIPLAMGVLLSPEHNAQSPTRTPDFVWRMRPGATTYRLLVNGSFRVAVGSGQCNQGAQTCTASGGAPITGPYALWQVQACYPGPAGTTVCGEPLRNPPDSVVRRVNFPSRN